MNFLLDTNILLHFIRRDETSRRIEALYQPFSVNNRAVVSVVSFGEIKSLAIQKDWGQTKLGLLERLLFTTLRSDITLDIVER
jgi:tRNA(fMet)-specific endonuclease VapC